MYEGIRREGKESLAEKKKRLSKVAGRNVVVGRGICLTGVDERAPNLEIATRKGWVGAVRG